VNSFKYQWYGKGEVSAAATIIFDILSIMTFVSIILQFGYNFPLDVILHYIIPGAVVGVVLGNAAYIWLSFNLAKKIHKQVTAMPFGLDAPSAIGFAVCIIGPSYSLLFNQSHDAHAAAIAAWEIGVFCLFIVGLIKLFSSIFVIKIKSIIPQAVLLGAIGGVAIALIGFIPLISIFRNPLVGILSFAIVFMTMFGRIILPFRLPGIPTAIILGTVIYYLLLPTGLVGSHEHNFQAITFALPHVSWSFIKYLDQTIQFIPLVIPFALLVIFGAMSSVESANCLGDTYNIRDIVVIDSLATIISSLCGGVLQTTPYAGFPAYKKFHAHSGYLFYTVIIVGIGGLLNIVGIIVNTVPEAVIAPVLLYVAFEITQQGFLHSERKYYPVLILSFFPSIAKLLQIKLSDGTLIDPAKFEQMNLTHLSPIISEHLSIVMLSNGFIITGMLWGSLLFFIMDRKWKSAIISTLILSIFSLFGIIHSIYITGEVYLPNLLPPTLRFIPISVALGYLLFGVSIFLLSLMKVNKKVHYWDEE
jgi:AGZA family xanthine/uracil permease-like MFS transporter